MPSPLHRVLTLGAGVVAFTAGAPDARAWWTTEHQEIGRAAYEGACAELVGELSAAATASPDVGARLGQACGRNAAALARLYGDGVAVAGDYLDHPAEFLSSVGAWRWRSRKSYWLLALENSEHFNPTSVRSWRDYHQRAVGDALAAAAGTGLATIAGFERALFESAFADHFLQDSFASGHMGFNRRASSAAAAKAFHDWWNLRPRSVADRAGHRWITYGDGRLARDENRESRERVIATATRSVHHVLAAFVLARPAPEEAVAIWDALPFTIAAPELAVQAMAWAEEQPHGSDALPLYAAVRPATKDVVPGATFWATAPFRRSDDPTCAVVAGLALGVPFLPGQSQFGAGGTIRRTGSTASPLVELGLAAPVGLSRHGLVTHEVGATGTLLLSGDVAVIVRAEYRVAVELGQALVRLHLGVTDTLDDGQVGWFGGLSLGYVARAAGGGRPVGPEPLGQSDEKNFATAALIQVGAHLWSFCGSSQYTTDDPGWQPA